MNITYNIIHILAVLPFITYPWGCGHYESSDCQATKQQRRERDRGRDENMKDFIYEKINYINHSTEQNPFCEADNR
jgi:hypothetical protein